MSYTPPINEQRFVLETIARIDELDRHPLSPAAEEHVLAALRSRITQADLLICSDYPRATQVTSDIVAAIPNLRPLDAGGLSQATPIESFTAVLLQLNVHYKTRVAVKFTGIPELESRPSPAVAEAAAAEPAEVDEVDPEASGPVDA